MPSRFGGRVTVVQGGTFVLCVPTFRPGIVGKIGRVLKRPLYVHGPCGGARSRACISRRPANARSRGRSKGGQWPPRQHLPLSDRAAHGQPTFTRTKAVPPPELLLSFFVASAVFACVPGPGMFYAAAQTLAHGRRAGWLSAVGFHLGGFVHITAAAFGVAILLRTVPVLYVMVKLLGAMYLVWLGIRCFVGSSKLHSATSEARPESTHKALRNSIIVEVLNPKTALFYLAFLPQFTDVSASLPVWAQVLVLGTIVNFMFSVTDAICIELSEAMASRLVVSHRAGRWAQRVGGSVLVALGVNLATSPQ